MIIVNLIFREVGMVRTTNKAQLITTLELGSKDFPVILALKKLSVYIFIQIKVVPLEKF
jgi:hypothetical protein